MPHGGRLHGEGLESPHRAHCWLGQCPASIREGTHWGHPPRRDMPVLSPPGTEEMLFPPCLQAMGRDLSRRLPLFPFLPCRVGSLHLLMPRLPCVAPISDVIFIDGSNDLILIMCCLEVQYLRGSTVTMSFQCIICLIQY